MQRRVQAAHIEILRGHIEQEGIAGPFAAAGEMPRLIKVDRHQVQHDAPGRLARNLGRKRGDGQPMAIDRTRFRIAKIDPAGECVLAGLAQVDAQIQARFRQALLPLRRIDIVGAHGGLSDEQLRERRELDLGPGDGRGPALRIDQFGSRDELAQGSAHFQAAMQQPLLQLRIRVGTPVERKRRNALQVQARFYACAGLAAHDIRAGKGDIEPRPPAMGGDGDVVHHQQRLVRASDAQLMERDPRRIELEWQIEIRRQFRRFLGG